MGTVLNLGCSDNIRPGVINVDLVPGPGVDVVCDLDDKWPWEDGTVNRIIAHDIFEHLPDIRHTMNEAHRVLCNGGILDLEVPTTDGRGAFQDPTHVSYWNRNTLFYFTEGDPHWKRFRESYGIAATFKVLSIHEGIVGLLTDKVTKLTAQLVAVK